MKRAQAVALTFYGDNKEYSA